MSRSLLILAACAASFISCAAVAADLGASASQSAALNDDDLAATRGGLQTPSGLEFDFGANLRTYVDGELVLETQLTWTEKGPMRREVSASGAANSVTEAWDGALPSLEGGETRVLHDLGTNRIASVVLNTANNRNIRQDTDLTLVIPQLAQFQQQAAAARTASLLDSAVGDALRNATAK